MRNRKTRVFDGVPIEDDIRTHDVLFGRGNSVACFPGNVQYRKIVHGLKEKYNKVDRNNKKKVAEEVFNTISASGGRFVEAIKVGSVKEYHEVSFLRALEKTSQALREKGRRRSKPKPVANTKHKSKKANLKVEEEPEEDDEQEEEQEEAVAAVTAAAVVLDTKEDGDDDVASLKRSIPLKAPKLSAQDGLPSAWSDKTTNGQLKAATKSRGSIRKKAPSRKGNKKAVAATKAAKISWNKGKKSKKSVATILNVDKSFVSAASSEFKPVASSTTSSTKKMPPQRAKTMPASSSMKSKTKAAAGDSKRAQKKTIARPAIDAKTNNVRPNQTAKRSKQSRRKVNKRVSSPKKAVAQPILQKSNVAPPHLDTTPSMALFSTLFPRSAWAPVPAAGMETIDNDADDAFLADIDDNFLYDFEDCEMVDTLAKRMVTSPTSVLEFDFPHIMMDVTADDLPEEEKQNTSSHSSPNHNTNNSFPTASEALLPIHHGVMMTDSTPVNGVGVAGGEEPVDSIVKLPSDFLKLQQNLCLESGGMNSTNASSGDDNGRGDNPFMNMPSATTGATHSTLHFCQV